jgi:hypothetical protein
MATNNFYNNAIIPSDEIYNNFNKFIFSNDIRIIGKLLQRYKFYSLTSHLPGDIVEVGVFKGSGMVTWLKFLQLYSPHTNKKVVGFDFFSSSDTHNYTSNIECGDQLNNVINRVKADDLALENVKQSIESSGINPNHFLLVKGDVTTTTKEFVKENPGFRISVLYLDLDLAEPTYHSLVNLWDRIVPGGYIIFDEFEHHKFNESSGVERFIKEKNIEYTIKTTDFVGPTAYMIKKSL